MNVVKIVIEGTNVVFETEDGKSFFAPVSAIPIITPPLNKYSLDYSLMKSKLNIPSLTQMQVDSIEAILQECAEEKVIVKEQVAYILATAWHESWFKPISEMGGEAYLKAKKYWPFYGRGFVQLTWGENYKKQGDRLGIDLVNNPDKVLEIPIAANILVNGMASGAFTGKKLLHYITPEIYDFVNARKIVNGMDKAQLIAGYATSILSCLS